jgi:hypothetical protein
VVYLEVLSWPWGTEKKGNNEKPQSGYPVSGHFLNTGHTLQLKPTCRISCCRLTYNYTWACNSKSHHSQFLKNSATFTDVMPCSLIHVNFDLQAACSSEMLVNIYQNIVSNVRRQRFSVSTEKLKLNSNYTDRATAACRRS